MGGSGEGGERRKETTVVEGKARNIVKCKWGVLIPVRRNFVTVVVTKS